MGKTSDYEDLFLAHSSVEPRRADGPLPDPFWLTRDRIGGELTDDIEVWNIRPERFCYEDGDVVWLAPETVFDAELDASCLGTWTVADARVRVGAGVPETDRECLRVGDEPIKDTKKVVLA